MPNYTYVCTAEGHINDLVRPIGTEMAPCPVCGERAIRSAVNRFHVVGPTVNTLKLAAGFQEAVAEREHIYQQAEARVGHPIPRPNDWAGPVARANERVRRGEVDASLYRDVSHQTIVGG